MNVEESSIDVKETPCIYNEVPSLWKRPLQTGQETPCIHEKLASMWETGHKSGRNPYVYQENPIENHSQCGRNPMYPEKSSIDGGEWL